MKPHRLAVFLFICWMLMSSCSKENNSSENEDLTNPFSPAKTISASINNITEWYEAVGTVRPRTEASIQAQITARVIDVKVKSGDKVKKDQLLVILDSRQFRAKLNNARQALNVAVAREKQARQGVKAAEAGYNRADSAYKRIQKYFDSKAATATDLENAESLFLQAKAELEREKEVLAAAAAGIRQNQQMVKEAEISSGYTQIIAPEDGEVVNKLVEQGDLATPGKPLIVLRTSRMLRLEAFVREGMIKKVKPGAKLNVFINTIDSTTEAVIEEIVPYADPKTRTFLVKAVLPPIDGLYPGMFGKLLIPVGEHKAVVIPASAICRVGQLELVSVYENEKWKTRYIKTGKQIGQNIEILSGLTGKEIIGY